MPNTIRWGILSTARIGRRFARAARNSGMAEVAAVSSREQSRALEWAKEIGAGRAFGSYQEMLDSGDIDAVYNALPNNLHKEWTIKALEAGLPVLCEKPFAADSEEAQEMADTARDKNLLLSEAFMYRHHPMYDRMIELLESNDIGELVSIHAKFGFALENKHDIRRSQELAGGSLMDVGCYCVNFARRLVGEEPVRVCAFERRTSVDESMQAILEFPSGVLAQIESSLESQLGREAKVRGTGGRILVEEAWLPSEDTVEFIVEKGGKRRVESVPGADPYQIQIEDFCRALLEGGQPRWGLQDAINNMKVIDALYMSARKGQQIVIDV